MDMRIKCMNCDMKFETSEQLKNHTAKFCINSDYGNHKSLEEKLKKTKKRSLDEQISSNDIKKFINNELPVEDKGAMDFEKLSSQVQDQQKSYKQALSKYISDTDLTEEIQRFQQAKKEGRSIIRAEDGALLDLLKDLNKKREREARYNSEKEQIAQSIKDVGKKDLTKIELERKNAIQKLGIERESLRKKEEQLLEDIERMQMELVDFDKHNKAKRVEAETIKIDPNLDVISKRQAEFARDRGKLVASLQIQKQSLENERERIMNDLKSVKQGNVTGLRKNTPTRAAGSQISLNGPRSISHERRVPHHVKHMSEQWQKDFSRLEELKKQNKEAQLFDVEKQQYRSKFAEGVSDMVKKAKFSHPAHKAKYFGQINEGLKKHTDGEKPKLPTQNKTLTLSNPVPPPVGEDPFNPIKTSLPKLQPDPAPEKPVEKSPEKPIEQPYPPQFIPQYPGYPYMPYYNPYYPSPYNMNFPPPPPQLPSRTEEDSSLKRELKKLKKKLKGKEDDEHYNSLQNALHSIKNKAMNINAPQGQLPNPEELMPEEKVLMNVQRQEAQDLRTLSELPKDSEIYQARMAHFKEMSQIRMRMEAMLQDLTMQRMKMNFEREMQLEEKRLLNEQWIEDQKRNLIANKMQPTEPPSKDKPNVKATPKEGFYIYWDYLIGAPQRYQQCQIVYGIYEYGTPVQEPKLIPPVNTDDRAENSRIALFAAETKVRQTPTNPITLLVVEIQGITADGTVSNIGWTVINPLQTRTQFQEGLWRIPLLKPPTDVTVDMKEIRNLPRIPQQYLYIRLAPSGSYSSVVNIKPDPRQEQYYKVPYLFQEAGAKPPTPPRLPSRVSDHPSRNLEIPIPNIPQSRQHSSHHTPPAPQRTPLDSSRAVTIKVKNIRNFRFPSDIKLRLSLRHGDRYYKDNQGQNCDWTSEMVRAAHYRPPTKDRRGLVIEKGCTFYSDFKRYFERSEGEVPIFLIVEVLENTSGQYETYAWSIFQISDNDAKSLIYGSFELNTYKPPVSFPDIDVTSLEKMEGILNFTVFEGTSEQRIPTVSAISRGKSSPPDSQIRRAFIENIEPQYNDSKLFSSGNGFDLYVDSARFLPDNVSAVKIIVRAYTSDLSRVGSSLGGLPDLESDAYFPQFDFRAEYRQSSFDPTTFILVTLLTIDTSNNEVRILGYTPINVFIDKNRKEQPTSKTETEFLLNKGNFQLPIYCQEPEFKDPFSLNSFKSLERIPCATLLMRILETKMGDDGKLLSTDNVDESEWGRLGLVVAAPKYETGVFNSAAVLPAYAERQLYKIRLDRRRLIAKEAVQKVQTTKGLTPDNDIEALIVWVDRNIQMTTGTGMIDMLYFAKYSPQIGFKMAVDMIYNTAINAPHVVSFCLNPPATVYFRQGPSPDSQFTVNLDWESALKSPCFLDNYYSYRGAKMNKNLHFIFEVISVNFTRKGTSIQTVGWTILPVFVRDDYVQTGVFQLPIVKGPVQVDLLAELASTDPWQTLVKKIGKNLQFLNHTSVVVRLVDIQRDTHFETPREIARMNYSYIPKSMMVKLAYNRAAEAKNKKQKKLNTLIPKGENTDTFNEAVNEALAGDANP